MEAAPTGSRSQTFLEQPFWGTWAGSFGAVVVHFWDVNTHFGEEVAHFDDGIALFGDVTHFGLGLPFWDEEAHFGD